uniref:Uncharacterized protein n=1 Tax=Timema genevievae TaxID=629358 RepID=A0A7R9JZD9_TIMGE|nr:unnamed protein product [Timema genevievae]
MTLDSRYPALRRGGGGAPSGSATASMGWLNTANLIQIPIYVVSVAADGTNTLHLLRNSRGTGAISVKQTPSSVKFPSMALKDSFPSVQPSASLFSVCGFQGASSKYCLFSYGPEFEPPCQHVTGGVPKTARFPQASPRHLDPLALGYCGGPPPPGPGIWSLGTGGGITVNQPDVKSRSMNSPNRGERSNCHDRATTLLCYLISSLPDKFINHSIN